MSWHFESFEDEVSNESIKCCLTDQVDSKKVRKSIFRFSNLVIILDIYPSGFFELVKGGELMHLMKQKRVDKIISL